MTIDVGLAKGVDDGAAVGAGLVDTAGSDVGSAAVVVSVEVASFELQATASKEITAAKRRIRAGRTATIFAQVEIHLTDASQLLKLPGLARSLVDLHHPQHIVRYPFDSSTS